MKELRRYDSSNGATRLTNEARFALGAAVILATGAATGAAIDHRIEAGSQQTEYASAADIASELKHGGIAHHIMVEAGYVLPLAENPDGIIAINSPIKIGPDEYGYFGPDLQSGDTHLTTVHYAGELPASMADTGDALSPHQVITDVGVVYSEYPVGGTGSSETGRYYSVVMGYRTGDVADMVTRRPGEDASTFQQEQVAFGKYLAEHRAGDPIYQGGK